MTSHRHRRGHPRARGPERSRPLSAPTPAVGLLRDVDAGDVWWYDQGDQRPVVCRSTSVDRYKVVTALADRLLVQGLAVLAVTGGGHRVGGPVRLTPAGRDVLTRLAAGLPTVANPTPPQEAPA